MPQFISYPKSGRTWLRHIFFKLNLEDKILFHHDGFEFNDSAMAPHNFDLRSRYKRYSDAGPIVYLERDPRDVLVSLFRQVTGRFRDFFNYQGTISQFIRDEYFGALPLMKFRNNWRELEHLPNVLVVKYEDCHEHCEAEMHRILEHFEYCPPIEMLREAIDQSTIENMRKIEESGSFPYPWLRKRNGHRKVAEGQTGSYRLYFGDADISYLKSIFPEAKE